MISSKDYPLPNMTMARIFSARNLVVARVRHVPLIGDGDTVRPGASAAQTLNLPFFSKRFNERE